MEKNKSGGDSERRFDNYEDFIDTLSSDSDNNSLSVAYELYDDNQNEDNYENDTADYDYNDGNDVTYHQHRANGFERFVYFIAHAFVWAVCLMSILFIFIFKVMTVSGNSMNPAIYDDDYIIINKLDRSPAFGDIAVILNNTGNKNPTVKRIAATEGQVVRIDYDKNVVKVDGVEVFTDIYSGIDIEPLGSVTYPVKVPEGCYFVLGDNLPNSLDSRSTTVGMVPKENILGTVVLGIHKGENIKFLDSTPIDTPIDEVLSDTLTNIKEALDNFSKSLK